MRMTAIVPIFVRAKVAPKGPPTPTGDVSVKLLYFAWVRERIGKPEEDLEPPAGIRTIADLMGKKKDEVMPPIKQDWRNSLNWFTANA